MKKREKKYRKFAVWKLSEHSLIQNAGTWTNSRMRPRGDCIVKSGSLFVIRRRVTKYDKRYQYVEKCQADKQRDKTTIKRNIFLLFYLTAININKVVINVNNN